MVGPLILAYCSGLLIGWSNDFFTVPGWFYLVGLAGMVGSGMWAQAIMERRKR